MVLSGLVHGCQYIKGKVSDHKAITEFEKNEDKIRSEIYSKDEIIAAVRKVSYLNGAVEEKESMGYSYKIDNFISLFIFTYDRYDFDGMFEDNAWGVALYADPGYLTSTSGTSIVHQIMNVLNRNVSLEDVTKASRQFYYSLSKDPCIGGIHPLMDSEYTRRCPGIKTTETSNWTILLENRDLMKIAYNAHEVNEKYGAEFLK